MTIHTFEQSKLKSEGTREASFWSAIYQKAFHDLASQVSIKQLFTAKQITYAEYINLERSGIDRLLTLRNGTQITIDEKNRYRADTGDIGLEYEHVFKDGTVKPGWIEKDLNIDFLAYGFIPSKRCYLFEWTTLRRAWIHHGSAWKAQYLCLPAHNRDYDTWNVYIPTKVLHAALITQSVIDL